MSLMEFMREYPDDETCLRHLWRERYAPDGEHADCPRCERERVFKRYETTRPRPAWYCQTCGFRIHPLKGTIFERSSTSLHLWFYAIYLITSTRCGISAKHLERELGVTYKTAWRMFNRIRNQLMDEPDAAPLSGQVEVDETWIGGKMRQSDRWRARATGGPTKGPYVKKRHTVMGLVERGGRIQAKVVPSRYGYTLRDTVANFVLPDSMVFTDDYGGYDGLARRYRHRRINHTARIYVDGIDHTQTIEGFFGLFKTGVRGAHHSVSEKWLQGYLNEWTWRYNRRESATPMFRDLLNEAVSRTL